MTKVIPFMKRSGLAVTISTLLIVAGFAYVLAGPGFNLGIDFEGGLSITADLGSSPSVGEVRSVVESTGSSTEVQRVGGEGSSTFVARVQLAADAEEVERQNLAQAVRTALIAEFGSADISSIDYVGPRFAEDLAGQSALLVIVASSLILLYVWLRFKFRFAMGAIAALFHDVLFIIAFIGVAQIEVNSATVAAVLTIIGYSLNDTIVIFDRVRENAGLMPDASLKSRVNTSITQSLSRTLVTSITTLIAIIAIPILAEGQIRDFAINLGMGILVGTYSSIFVASPVMMFFAKFAKDEKKKAGTAPKAEQGSLQTNESASVDHDAVLEQIKKQKAQKQKKQSK